MYPDVRMYSCWFICSYYLIHISIKTFPLLYIYILYFLLLAISFVYFSYAYYYVLLTISSVFLFAFVPHTAVVTASWSTLNPFTIKFTSIYAILFPIPKNSYSLVYQQHWYDDKDTLLLQGTIVFLLLFLFSYIRNEDNSHN